MTSEWHGLTAQQLQDRLLSIRRRASVLNWELGMGLVEMERTRAYLEFAFNSLVAYAWAILELHPQKCRELLRACKTLQRTPIMAEAFRTGALSWSRVRELTRHVTAENDARLTELGRKKTAQELSKQFTQSPAQARAQASRASQASRTDHEPPRPSTPPAPPRTDSGGMASPESPEVDEVGATASPAPVEAQGKTSSGSPHASPSKSASVPGQGPGGDKRDNSMVSAVGAGQLASETSAHAPHGAATHPAQADRVDTKLEQPEVRPEYLPKVDSPSPEEPLSTGLSGQAGGPEEGAGTDVPKALAVTFYLTPDQFAVYEQAASKAMATHGKRIGRAAVLVELCTRYLTSGSRQSNLKHMVHVHQDEATGHRWYETERGRMPATAPLGEPVPAPQAHPTITASQECLDDTLEAAVGWGSVISDSQGTTTRPGPEGQEPVDEHPSMGASQVRVGCSPVLTASGATLECSSANMLADLPKPSRYVATSVVRDVYARACGRCEDCGSTIL